MPRGSIMGTGVALRHTVTTKMTDKGAYCIYTEASEKFGLYNYIACPICLVLERSDRNNVKKLNFQYISTS